jgi:hypothetical protein
MSRPDPRREIRRQNAKQLAASIGGQAEFGRKTGMSDSQITQNLGEKPTKNIGNLIADRIEKAFGLPPGWLDVLHDDIDQPLPLISTAQTTPRVEIPLFHIDQDEIDIINSYRRAMPEDKKSIRAAAAAALENLTSSTLDIDHKS